MTLGARATFFRLALLVQLQLLLWCCAPAGSTARSEECSLDPMIRPVILVHGFRNSLLFNSTAGYSLEWLDPLDLAPGNEGRGDGDLDLPLAWDELSLTQDFTDVGPERFEGDETPGLFLPDGTLVPVVNLVCIIDHVLHASTYKCKRCCACMKHAHARRKNRHSRLHNLIAMLFHVPVSYIVSSASLLSSDHARAASPGVLVSHGKS